MAVYTARLVLVTSYGCLCSSVPSTVHLALRGKGARAFSWHISALLPSFKREARASCGVRGKQGRDTCCLSCVEIPVAMPHRVLGTGRENTSDSAALSVKARTPQIH